MTTNLSFVDYTERSRLASAGGGRAEDGRGRSLVQSQGSCNDAVES